MVCFDIFLNLVSKANAAGVEFTCSDIAAVSCAVIDAVSCAVKDAVTDIVGVTDTKNNRTIPVYSNI